MVERMFALQFLPKDLVGRINAWADLKRWERKEIGQTLRRMGLSYREIAAVIPVHKGTLSGWCRDIDLGDEHARRLSEKRAERREIGRRLHQRAVDRAQAIRETAHTEADRYLCDPFWVAGVTAYWAEGAKRSKHVRFSNSDPALVVLFIAWTERYLRIDRERLTVQLHLHSGQDDQERKRYWSEVTGIPIRNFRKTYVKSEGTGHRKNVLYNGTATIRVPCSTDLLHCVLGWADAVAERYATLGYPAAGC